MGQFFANNSALGADFSNDTQWKLSNNNLYDIGFNVQYKLDWLLAYVSFVKNIGGFDIVPRVTNVSNPFALGLVPLANNPGVNVPNTAGAATNAQSPEYTGWMVDAGVTYFCGPWTANVGGFYTTGPSIDKTVGNNGGMGQFGNTNKPFNGLSSTDVNWFTYPVGGGAKYSSEVMGGGVLGDDFQDASYYVQRGSKFGVSANSVTTGNATFSTSSGLSSLYWRSFQQPSNVWTITAGGSYQLTPTTKLSGSYWYWGTTNDVPIGFNANASVTAATPLGTAANPLTYKMSSSIGHELDFYVDQQIVDGLTLTLVGAYLFSNDAFCPLPFMSPAATQMGAATFASQANSVQYQTGHAEDAWKLGARLLWSF